MLGKTLMVCMALLMVTGCASTGRPFAATAGPALQQQRQIVDDVPAMMRTIKPWSARLRYSRA
jgi:uncharacterized lipoprotein YajG